MNTKKINLLPLDESLEENFLNEKCNILLNNGNEFFIDLNHSLLFPLEYKELIRRIFILTNKFSSLHKHSNQIDIEFR